MFIANCLSSLLVCKENMDIVKLKLAGCSPASLPRRKSLTIHRGAEPCHTLLIKPWPNLIKAKDNGTFSSLDKITFYLSALSLILKKLERRQTSDIMRQLKSKETHRHTRVPNAYTNSVHMDSASQWCTVKKKKKKVAKRFKKVFKKAKLTNNESFLNVLCKVMIWCFL